MKIDLDHICMCGHSAIQHKGERVDGEYAFAECTCIHPRNCECTKFDPMCMNMNKERGVHCVLAASHVSEKIPHYCRWRSEDITWPSSDLHLRAEKFGALVFNPTIIGRLKDWFFPLPEKIYESLNLSEDKLLFVVRINDVWTLLAEEQMEKLLEKEKIPVTYINSYDTTEKS